MSTGVFFLLVATLTLQVASRSAPQISYLNGGISKTAGSSAHHLNGSDIESEATCFVVNMHQDGTSISIYKMHNGSDVISNNGIGRSGTGTGGNNSISIGGRGIDNIGIHGFGINTPTPGNVNTSNGRDGYGGILSGNYFKMNHGDVRIQVISPKRHQEINVCDNRVLVNNEVVSNDTRTLSAEPKYQKREDGSMWYTNLKVGTEMTAEEIGEFKRNVEQTETKIEKALEEARKQRETVIRQMEAASEMRKRIREEARRQAETASKMEKRMKEEASRRMGTASETERIMEENARKQIEAASEMERRMREEASRQMKAVAGMERGIREEATQMEMEHKIGRRVRGTARRRIEALSEMDRRVEEE